MNMMHTCHTDQHRACAPCAMYEARCLEASSIVRMYLEKLGRTETYASAKRRKARAKLRVPSLVRR